MSIVCDYFFCAAKGQMGRDLLRKVIKVVCLSIFVQKVCRKSNETTYLGIELAAVGKFNENYQKA